MAQNGLTFVIDFLTKGLKEANSGINSVGKGTRAASQGYQDAEKHAHNYYNTQEKGTIGTANSTKSFSKLAETMGSSSGIVGAYATLAANVFAVSAAFNALRGAAQVQQIQQGLEAMGNRVGTTLSVAARNLQQISNMTLTYEQSLRSTAQISSAGLGTKAVEDLGKVANNVSVALGRNMSDSMDRLTRGVVKLEPELLDELGLMTRIAPAVDVYANKVGKSVTQLSTFERQQAFLNAIVLEGTAKFDGLAESAGNTRNLDLLGATFTNLTNNILGFVNKAGLPLAGIFSSQGIMLAGMLLFASTISKQLLPGLSNLHVGSQKAAQELVNLAQAQAQQIPVLDKGNRSFKALNASMREGKASAAQYVAGLAETRKNIALLEGQLANNVNSKGKPLTKRGRDEKTDTLGILDAQKSALEKIVVVEAKAATQEAAVNAIQSAGSKQRLLAMQQLERATYGYFVQLTAVRDMELETAQVGTLANVKKAFADVIPGIKRMGAAIAAAWSAEGASKLKVSLAVIKTAFFGAAVGARVLGAALLDMIPVIGQIILVASILWDLVAKPLWHKWQGKDVIALNDAIKEQEEVIGHLSERYAEMNRVRNSVIPVAQRENQIYTIMTNTVRENIAEYEKLKVAQDKVFASKSTVKAGDTAEVKTLKALHDMGSPEIANQIDQALGKRGLSGILEDTDRQISKSQLSELANVMKVDLSTGAVTLGDHIHDLAEAFKNADTAIADFNRNAIPSTPYDTVVKNMDEVSNSLTNISTNAAFSDDYIARMAETMTAAGPNFQKFFTPDTQNLIKQFNELDQLIQSKQGAATQNELNRKRGLEEQLALRSQEIYATQQIFENAQHLSRQTQTQITLEQTRLDKLNKYTALTGNSIRERRAAENNILQLQAEQIASQAEIVKRQIELTKIEIEHQKVLLETNSLYMEIGATIATNGEITQENFMGEISRRIIKLRAEKGSMFGRSDESIDEDIKKLLVVEGQYQKIKGLNTEIRDKQDEVTTLAGQQAAALAKQTSAVVVNAEAIATNAKTAAENSQKNLDIVNEHVKLTQLQADLQVKLQGRVKNTAEEYQQMVASQELVSRAQKLQLASESASNIRQMKLEQARAAGHADEIAAYEVRIGQEVQLTQAKLATIDAQNRLNILEKFGFDVHSAGLTMQKDALSSLEKQVEVQSEYVGLQREGRNLTLEIARKRSGRANNEYTDRSAGIAEARDQLHLAQDQAAIRKTSIVLEYALLDAQRQQAIWNLQAQREILAVYQGVNSDNVKQLDATIALLKQGAGAIASAQEMALGNVDKNIENLAKKLESAGLPEARGNFIGSARDDIIKAARDAKSAIKESTTAQKDSVATPFQTYIAPLTTSTNSLKVAVDSNTDAINNVLLGTLTKIQKEPIPQLTQVVGALGDFAKQATAAGLRVSEMAGYGGVHPVHHGRGHYDGRAFDASIAGGNADSTNPKFRAQMDALAKKFVSEGLIVLWNGQRLSGAGNRALTASEGMHRDHMHVEIPKDSAQVVGTAVGQAIKQPVVDAVNDNIDTSKPYYTPANDNPAVAQPAPVTSSEQIKVMGHKDVSMPKDFGTLADLFKNFTSEGDFNMLSVFQDMADKLGPQGSIVPNILTGINTTADAFKNFQQVMSFKDENGKGNSFADKFAAGAAVAQTALATISSVLQAASDAKIAGIDREIAAEQKRDGKSAESVAKIQALESKKDAIARKAFNTNKKLMMAQAIIATAAGIAQSLTLPFPMNIIMAGIIGALGAAQIAIIAGTQYQSTNAPSAKATMPDTLTIGKRGDSVDVAKYNPNVGGEVGYLRGTRGTGSNSSNYATIGSAYGGPLPRGYGHNAFVVGEKGPEVIERNTPISVRPINDNHDSRPLNVNFNVTAFDGESVNDMLYERRGDLIDMFRQAANANGSTFLEDVNTHHIKKANRTGATRI